MCAGDRGECIVGCAFLFCVSNHIIVRHFSTVCQGLTHSIQSTCVIVKGYQNKRFTSVLNIFLNLDGSHQYTFNHVITTVCLFIFKNMNRNVIKEYKGMIDFTSKLCRVIFVQLLKK